jgi:hypothetical protein
VNYSKKIPKGLMPLKIQTKIKSCLLPEFVIQYPFDILICGKMNVSPFYLFCHPKIFANFFSSGMVDLSIYKV